VQSDLLTRNIRDWTGPDGTTWMVTLEPAPRHLTESHDRRRILLFTSRLEANARERVRFVADGFDLEAASDDALATLLRAR
jgi:hypothetical protein